MRNGFGSRPASPHEQTEPDLQIPLDDEQVFTDKPLTSSYKIQQHFGRRSAPLLKQVEPAKRNDVNLYDAFDSRSASQYEMIEPDLRIPLDDQHTRGNEDSMVLLHKQAVPALRRF